MFCDVTILLFLGTLKVTFQPGQSHANICIAINDDDIKEQSKRFRLTLSIPNSVGSLGVSISHPYYADVLVTGMWQFVCIYACINVHDT